MRSAVPASRLRTLQGAPVRSDAGYVLYWMVAQRRVSWNYALDRAVEWARELSRPLVVFEPLSCEYPYASDRLHRFVLEGMAEHERRLASSPALYVPWVEPAPRAGRGLLEALAQDACVVVTDEHPCFWTPRMTRAAASRLSVRCEAVDSNGLLPLRGADREFATAHAFRRFLQRALPEHLAERPRARPFAGSKLPVLATPPPAFREWRGVAPAELLESASSLSALPIDHDVAPGVERGGSKRARQVWRRFVETALDSYGETRNHPDCDASSGLSAFLHFGHVSSHELFADLAELEGWSPAELSPDTRGRRSGWWGMSSGAEAFLDQLVTWRELGFNSCARRDDYAAYGSLPDWALRTLEAHASDRRDHLYSLEQFEKAATHDELWNACQRQLVREGRIHSYLRMLWGKKILAWSPHPRDALRVMIALNDRYALDGRDPNSYSGIGWVLGRFDRPWGPEREVFGKVRYMSSRNTARKLQLREYLLRYAAEPGAAEELALGA